MTGTASRWGWWALVALLAVVVGTGSAAAQGLYDRGDPQRRPHLRLQQRGGGGQVRGVRRDGTRHHAAGHWSQRRDGRGRQRARPAALLLQAQHLGSGAKPTPPLQRIVWSDGKTRMSTDFAYLEIFKPRARTLHPGVPDDTITLPGTGSPGDTKGSFRIRRAKFKLEGWFWAPPEVAPWLPPGAPPSPRTMPKLSYEVQLNWAAVSANVGAQPSNVGAILEDANIAWDPQGMGKFRVVFGQYKVPFGRQEMTSSGSQQFVDRSLVSNEFARGRDIGVSVQGAVWSNKLEDPRRDVQRERADEAEQRQRQVPIQRPADVAAERQSGAGAARVGQWGVVPPKRTSKSTTVPLYALGRN